MSLYCLLCGTKLNLWDVIVHKELEEGIIEYPAINGSCPECHQNYHFEKIDKRFYQIELKTKQELHVIVDSDFWESCTGEEE